MPKTVKIRILFYCLSAQKILKSSLDYAHNNKVNEIGTKSLT